MHLVVVEAHSLAVVEAFHPIRIPAAAFDGSAAIVVQARQGVDVAAVAPIQRADGFHLLGRQDFIAVDIEHPIVARQTGGQVFHRAEADKFVMVHGHIGEAAGNVERAVGGAVVEHDDFVKRGQRG